MDRCDVCEANPTARHGRVRRPGQACDQDVLPGRVSAVHSRGPH
jgi:hypothetical protein